MTLVLGIGLVLVALSSSASVHARRRDIGRQRAMGASRSSIVALVLLQYAIAGLIGTTVGTLTGAVWAKWWVADPGARPSPLDPGFLVGVALLGVLVTVGGAALPAIAAAWRDPVRILRVP